MKKEDSIPLTNSLSQLAFVVSEQYECISVIDAIDIIQRTIELVNMDLKTDQYPV